MSFSHLFLLFWTVVILYVLGQIWVAQIAVYPLFGQVGEEEYVTYHKFYSSRIPLPVIAPGLAASFCQLRSSSSGLTRCSRGWHWRTWRAGSWVCS